MRTKTLLRLFQEQNADLDSMITGNPERFSLANVQRQYIKTICICRKPILQYHPEDPGGGRNIIKEKFSIDTSKSAFNEPVRLLGVILGVTCLVFAWFLFQSVEPSPTKEKKDEQTAKDAQERVPDSSILPGFISNDCIDKNRWLLKEVDFPGKPLHNPYFLRGDFDGDGNSDYAVIVEGLKNRREGLLVCFRNKEAKVVLLGLDPNDPPPFWRLTDWDVLTPAEVNKTLDHKGIPIGINPKGESIVMYREDAIGVVYWDGKEFRWKQVILNEGI